MITYPVDQIKRMQGLRYISFLAFIFLTSLNMGAQEVDVRLGGLNSESWDAIDCDEQGDCFFAIGFRESTEIKGIPYEAIDRDVLIGSYRTGGIMIYGQLASASDTKVAFLDLEQGRIFLGGNAFSFLTYQGDTLFQSKGDYKAFVLELNTEGQLLAFQMLDATASALMEAGAFSHQKRISILRINDSVRVDQNTFIPVADETILILQWDSLLRLVAGFQIDAKGNMETSAFTLSDSALYLAGNFKGVMLLGKDSIETRTADSDGFLIKMGYKGHLLFVKHLKGVYEDEVRAIALGRDRIFVGGQFIGGIEFDGIQIVTGLSKAGFVGAFDLDGRALWLEAVRGDDVITAVHGLEAVGQDLLMSAQMGKEIIYRGDTIGHSSQPGAISSILVEMDARGQLRDWHLFPGDPLVIVSRILGKGETPVIALEFTGMFEGVVSEGGYDLLLLQWDFSRAGPIGYSQFSVYPNPCSGILHFPDALQGSSYRIFDVEGRLHLTGKLEDANLDVSQLRSGMYSIWIVSTEMYFTRFIKI